ncbi:peptidyl-alpha-hydroxyglycine alpha-amidating lyase 2-like isoform X1 [Diabrotica undecimpunctata]|uniref:peptidyl-alpha-hydroxyglycine alpha-amidating lyase 2-like isoform X1 n=1 Tax=Diabrotica undecimpunctata TaxID=50387 RepID=UPI003B6340D6
MVTSIVSAVSVFGLLVLQLSALPFEDDGQRDTKALYDEVRQLLQLNQGYLQDAPQSEEQTTVADISEKPDVPKVVQNWPEEPLKLGQVSGVSVNSALQPVIFHRVDRVWDETTFNETHHYQQTHLGPIREHTVLTLDPQTGKVLGRWGADFFYMPHGLTIDRHDNIWVTDVALHQVFKFKPGELQPSQTFGQRLEPGADKRHFCKPTSTAIASTGEIFIADGYCNSRILKYNAAGVLLRIFPTAPEILSLQVPHGLALIESLDRICVADRENMRVVCPRAGLYTLQGKKEPPLTITLPDMGRVFGVSAKGKLVYAVNGPTSTLPVQGMTIDPQTESVIDHWAPEEKLGQKFGNPHDIAVCPNGSALYVVEIYPNRVWKFDLVQPKK